MLPLRFLRVMVTLVSGVGSIVFVTFLSVQAAKGSPVPPLPTLVIWFGICNVAFILAGFTVWWDEHNQVSVLTAELTRPRPNPAIELRRGPFNESIAKLSANEKAALLEVWRHGQRDADQVRRSFKERGVNIGSPGRDELNSANKFLERVAQKTGLIRGFSKTNEYAIYELNPDLKPL